MSNWLIIGHTSFQAQHFSSLLEDRGETVTGVSLREFPWRHAQYDYIVNFAALNVVPPSWLHPGYYARVNIEKQIQVLEFIRSHKFKKYVHVSTPEVYGHCSKHVGEDYPYNPSTPYAASRAGFEMFLNAYARQYDLPVAITRGCNVYGPGQQLYRLIPKLFACIKKGEPFRLEGNGESVRSFLHVRDMVEGIYIVAKQGHGVYHIASQLEDSISDLVGRLCSIADVSPADVIENAPGRVGQDAAYRLYSAKLRRLGWKETIPLQRGLEDTWRWINEDWDTVQKWPMHYEIN